MTREQRREGHIKALVEQGHERKQAEATVDAVLADMREVSPEAAALTPPPPPPFKEIRTTWRGDKLVSTQLVRHRAPRHADRRVGINPRQHDRTSRRQPTRRSSRRTRSTSSAGSGSSGLAGDDPEPAPRGRRLTASELAATGWCFADDTGSVPWDGWADLERESRARCSA
jgi:hypothetical protein